LIVVVVIEEEEADDALMEGRCNGSGRDAMGRPNKDEDPALLDVGSDLTFLMEVVVVPVGGDLSCEKVSGTGGAGGRTAAGGRAAGTTAGAARLPVR
jgi:hypothetical protein